MKISGWLSLGGRQATSKLDVPDHGSVVEGTIEARTRGQWMLTHDARSQLLSIPSRDKQVQLIGDLIYEAGAIASIDSEEGPNYRTKLLPLVDVEHDFCGALVNRSTSTHSSFAILTNQQLWLWGLHDQYIHHSYLLWSSEPETLHRIVQAQPLRHLIYRFPEPRCLFLPVESICAKWWRWQQGQNDLMAFNALERRLFGPL
jgi:hypothetical protein